MRKLSTTSLADLLDAMRVHPSELDQCAAVFGYERVFVPPPTPASPKAKPDSTSPRSEPTAEPPKPEIRFPTERPRLKFLMPIRAEKLQSVPPHPVGNPITNAALAVDWNWRGPRLQPLVRWSRMGSFLRNRLGRTIEGTAIDQAKLSCLAGNGAPLTVVPRLKRRAWAPQAVLLWDVTPEMSPFARDAKWLLHQLQHERGKFGLVVKRIRRTPRVCDVGSVPAGTPILALSAMGCFLQSPDITASWIKLAKRLADAGSQLLVLNPCPRDRWPRNLAVACQSVVWDRQSRLPRKGGQKAAGQKADKQSSFNPVVEQLLTLLSPASLIEAPLLRAARLKLGSNANAGTEWDAWHHADSWHSIDSFGIKPGEPFASRLEQRRQLKDTEAELAQEIGKLIVEHHQGCSSVIRAEAELRACLAGAPNEVTLNRLKGLLQSVIDRLRQVAMQPGGAEGDQTGLPTWFIQMMDRLSPAMYADRNIKELLSQGLALAHAWAKTPRVTVPIEMDHEVYKRELRSVHASLPMPIPFETALAHKDLLVFPASGRPDRHLFPLGLIRAGHGHIHFDVSGQEPSTVSCDNTTTADVVLHEKPAKITIETPYARLHLEAIERPTWATRMWQDKYGTAAEFVIRDVPFVLRWIPPGTFWMGSPESEVGRSSDEGPRHEVTISQGYWMGETPVTQSQWQAIVEEGQAKKLIGTKVDLKSKPSDFSAEGPEGKGDLPVEQVNWFQSTSLCQVLDKLLENGPRFRLPTEAEWEHACRAGTKSAFNDGSDCTLPEGLDPALAQLGWFDKNSGLRTQFVKQKPANQWGLYDVHGNVWEWCLDGMREFSNETQFNPLGPNDESAARVVRGGSWYSQARSCRAAYRDLRHPGYRWDVYGLRLSAGQDLEKPESAEPKRRSRGGGT